MRIAVALGALWLAACAPAEQAQLDIHVGDAAAYERWVHPVLEASCATLDCHGDFDRPLRLYAETGLRMRDDLRGEPITEEELVANVRSLAAVDPDREPVEQSLVLLAPLARSAGGVHHLGGDLWASTDDVSYRCVLAFLGDQSYAAAARGACAEAYDEVGLAPP